MQKLLLVLLILTCFTTSYAAPRCKQRKSKKRNIIAPPRVKNRKTLRPDVEKSFDCQEDMCNGTSRYPLRYLMKMMRNNNKALLDFTGSALKPFEEEDIGGRWLHEDDEKQVNMCSTKEYFMVPRVARNVDYEWRFVVQIGNITQSVQYDKCKEHSYCFAREYIPNNYATSCKQHKVVIRLLTLQPNGTISLDYFPIPGGCACAYNKVKYS